jgi:hypothetical protein
MAGVGGVSEFDQRGPDYDRVFGSRIDIGALERQDVGSALQLLVDTLVDEVDGDHSPSDLSMREAVALANGNAGFADTIAFDPKLAGGSILLVHGELAVNDTLTITGLGADRLTTIDASGSDPTPDENNGDGSRIFSVDSSGSSVGIDLAISDLRLIGGDTLHGGAIFVRGGTTTLPTNLTISQCMIEGNSSTGDGGGVFAQVCNLTIASTTVAGNMAERDGGGIDGMSLIGPMSVTNSAISDNWAGGNGGGIYGDATVVRSTINGNMASGIGGGLRIVEQGSITDSLIAHNSAGTDGGGIYARISSSREFLSISNTTISENVAGDNGGGVRVSVFSDASASIAYCTITRNVAGIEGGGVWDGSFGSDVSAVLTNSIIAGNSTDSGSTPDVRPLRILIRHSLIGDLRSAFAEAPVGMPDANGNLVGGPMHGPIDPRLGPLASNGGPTMTHALLAGSPAINAGDQNAMAGVGGVPQYDQRSEPFRRVYGGRIDIGAFEAQPNPLTGDYNFNGVVDAADMVIWRKTLGSRTDLRADGNGDGVVNQADWQVWRGNFGRTAESTEQGAGSMEPEAAQAPPNRLAWQPPASPGVSFSTTRQAFRPLTQRFALADDLLESITSPRAMSNDRNEFSPERRDSMGRANADAAELSFDAVDRVFETVGAKVAGTGHPATGLAGCRVGVP